MWLFNALFAVYCRPEDGLLENIGKWVAGVRLLC